MKKSEFELIRDEIQYRIDSGKLSLNKNNKYVASMVFKDLDIRVHAHAQSAEEAALKIIEARDRKLAKKDKANRLGKRFDDLCMEWFNSEIDGKGLGEKNVSNYIGILNNHIIKEFKSRGIKTIKYDDLNEFIKEKSKQYSKSQMLKITQCLKSIFDYAIDKEYIEKNPTNRLNCPKKCKKFDNSKANPVRDEEMVLALKNSKNDFQMRAILLLLYIYGLRSIELVNLKWQNINFEEEYIHVEVSKYTGSVNVEDDEAVMRYLPLSKTVETALLELKTIQIQDPKIVDDYIFHKRNSKKPLDVDTLDDYFGTLHNQIDVNNGAKIYNNQIVESTNNRRFVPYSFRKTVVTRLNSMNFNDAITQQFVGHKPKSVKDRHYSKMNFELDLRQAYQPYIECVETKLNTLI